MKLLGRLYLMRTKDFKLVFCRNDGRLGYLYGIRTTNGIEYRKWRVSRRNKKLGKSRVHYSVIDEHINFELTPVQPPKEEVS
jgi:hypothetical protein